jgi:hypothetical protein
MSISLNHGSGNMPQRRYAAQHLFESKASADITISLPIAAMIARSLRASFECRRALTSAFMS